MTTIRVRYNDEDDDAHDGFWGLLLIFCTTTSTVPIITPMTLLLATAVLSSCSRCYYEYYAVPLVCLNCLVGEQALGMAPVPVLLLLLLLLLLLFFLLLLFLFFQPAYSMIFCNGSNPEKKRDPCIVTAGGFYEDPDMNFQTPRQCASLGFLDILVV